MGCNMRCKHCGSACEDALEDELSTEEALELCDQIVDLGFEWIHIVRRRADNQERPGSINKQAE